MYDVFKVRSFSKDMFIEIVLPA